MTLVVVAGIAVTPAGCATAPPAFPPSAQAAYVDLKGAVAARQRDLLWRTLDQRTRDTWQIAWRARRAAHELLPLLQHEHVASDPELQKLPAAPPARAQDLFSASFSDADWTDLHERFDPAARLIELGRDAEALTPTGERLSFRKAADGSWGFAGLAELARQGAQREMALLDRIGALLELQTPGLRPGSMPWR
jgi:hypothetical protein